MKECILQPLSPREIQARVRAGASPEVVAAETGWPLDRVIRYAEPLLGERSYVASQAAAVEVSRSRGGATLHQSVCVRLDVDPETQAVSWDSYRNPEGRWVVTAFHDGAAVGTWLFEEVGRSVHPQDEAARALMGGGPTVVTTADEGQPEPSVISDQGYSGADDAGGFDEGGQTAPGAKTAGRPRLVSVTSDPTATQSPQTPATRSGDAEPASELFSTDQLEADQFEADQVDNEQPGNQDESGSSDSSSSTSNPAAPAAPKRAKRSKGKRGRTSVPSWDEILFGATKNDD